MNPPSCGIFIIGGVIHGNTTNIHLRATGIVAGFNPIAHRSKGHVVNVHFFAEESLGIYFSHGGLSLNEDRIMIQVTIHRGLFHDTCDLADQHGLLTSDAITV